VYVANDTSEESEDDDTNEEDPIWCVTPPSFLSFDIRFDSRRASLPLIHVRGA